MHLGGDHIVDVVVKTSEGDGGAHFVPFSSMIENNIHQHLMSNYQVRVWHYCERWSEVINQDFIEHKDH